MITLRDLLSDEKFSMLKVLNSKADLTRKIATVESSETPDIANYLAPHSFLLTTAMVFKDNQDQLVELVENLNQLPTAALGIKLGRFVDKLDDGLIKRADELGFPLIQIPMDATLGTVFHSLLSHLWSNQNQELLFSLNIQRKFSNLMIKNTSLSALVRSLSHTLKEPIALVDPFGNVIHSSSNINSKYSKNFLRKLVEDYPLDEDNSSTIDVDLKGAEEGNVANVFPIKMAGYYPYYLIVFNAEKLKFPLSTMAIEQAIMILAFTLYKNLRVNYSGLAAREDFFKDIIHSKPHEKLSENQLLFMGKKYGLVQSSNYRAIIVKIHENQDEQKDSVLEESYILVYNWLMDKLEKDLKDSILFPNRDKYEYVILLQSDPDSLLERLTAYRNILEKTLQLKAKFFLGNRVQDLSSIQYSYREAREAIRYGETRNNIDYIRYFSQMETFDLLNLLPKHQIDSFIANNLKGLAYPQDEAGRDLRETLKIYLDLNCRITETANKLFIHRNTVKYRIDRCNEILGFDVSEATNSLKLRLCLAYTEEDS